MASELVGGREESLDVQEAPLSAEEILATLAKEKAAAVAPQVPSVALQPPPVRSPALTKARQWQLGFGPKAAAPYSISTEVVQPSCLFRGERLIMQGDPALQLSGLFVGTRNQLPSAAAIPIYVFDPLSLLDSGYLLDTCEPAIAITMSVQNPTAATLTWSAVMFGRAVL